MDAEVQTTCDIGNSLRLLLVSFADGVEGDQRFFTSVQCDCRIPRFGVDDPDIPSFEDYPDTSAV